MDWTLAITKFEAFRTHPPNWITQEAVDEFHAILSMLETAGSLDLSAFRIPDSQMKPKIVGVSRGTRSRAGRVQMSARPCCDDDYFKRQVDGVALYIQNLTPPEPRKVGF
jgi:hypothetical protein